MKKSLIKAGITIMIGESVEEEDVSQEDGMLELISSYAKNGQLLVEDFVRVKEKQMELIYKKYKENE